MTDPAAPPWQIVPLAERPDLVMPLAEALWQFWHPVFPGKTVDVRAASLRARTNRDRVPVAVVAVAPDGLALGTASILLDDMETRPDLNPWLATVFVMPGQRGRGLGGALCAAAEAAAWRLGVPRLHLFTFDKRGYYAGLGWQDLETVDYAGRPTAIMVKDRPA
ncbi:GNAT family N-acetyltransferase [Stella sp.]|uniref:GNAT family N-acetyltransferase n=1 Tax=Stella sp. TaxID=2912054 RepID=UPI0035AE4BB6